MARDLTLSALWDVLAWTGSKIYSQVRDGVPTGCQAIRLGDDAALVVDDTDHYRLALWSDISAAGEFVEDEDRWTEQDMILAACDYWGEGFAAEDCRVIEFRSTDGPSLVVLHEPTGRTSGEAGDGGRWNLDGTAQ